ncbi:hypothetical protein CLCR_07851 [Cladophialophora carrionii]|uniref:Uncharacterized protein n=1 Tax=Cladophialophora carrionii TaxID=86049 RepID=A0A1C1CM18_9EURO|nr:hypothetical protein CLCR_07851 [Cladophialophora carrionii]
MISPTNLGYLEVRRIPRAITVYEYNDAPRPTRDPLGVALRESDRPLIDVQRKRSVPQAGEALTAPLPPCET